MTAGVSHDTVPGMKAFWWFDEGKIAGMARPGFNHCRWFDLPFDEAMVMGWIGQHSTGSIPLRGFREHIETYARRASVFYQLSDQDMRRHFAEFADVDALTKIVERLAANTRFLTNSKIADDHLHFEILEEQLDAEIAQLKANGIDRVVTLTEAHHAKDRLSRSFDVHHISIVDMGAPTRDQAHELAKILDLAEHEQEAVAVHCLAGIGRTSTLLIAAEMLRGKQTNDLLAKVAKQNPYYAFSGVQAEFIRSLDLSLNAAQPTI